MAHKIMLKKSEGIILYDDDGKPFLLTKKEYGKADRRFKRRFASSAMLKDLAKMNKK
jgi:hypothetical protein